MTVRRGPNEAADPEARCIQRHAELALRLSPHTGVQAGSGTRRTSGTPANYGSATNNTQGKVFDLPLKSVLPYTIPLRSVSTDGERRRGVPWNGTEAVRYSAIPL